MSKKSRKGAESFQTHRKLRDESGKLIGKIYRSRQNGQLFKVIFKEDGTLGHFVPYTE